MASVSILPVGGCPAANPSIQATGSRFFAGSVRFVSGAIPHGAPAIDARRIGGTKGFRAVPQDRPARRVYLNGGRVAAEPYRLPLGGFGWLAAGLRAPVLPGAAQPA